MPSIGEESILCNVFCIFIMYVVKELPFDICKKLLMIYVLSNREEIISVKRSLEHLKRVASDDVWVGRFYAWRLYSVKEAVECHKETHHPTIYNVSDAPVNLFIELDMTTERPVSLITHDLLQLHM